MENTASNKNAINRKATRLSLAINYTSPMKNLHKNIRIQKSIHSGKQHGNVKYKRNIPINATQKEICGMVWNKALRTAGMGFRPVPCLGGGLNGFTFQNRMLRLHGRRP